MNAQWIAKVAASAVIRKVVYLLVTVTFAFVCAFFSGKAHAQAATCMGEDRECETRALAWQAITAHESSSADWCPLFGAPGPRSSTFEEVRVAPSGESGAIYYNALCGTPPYSVGQSVEYTWTSQCTNGGAYNSVDHTCFDSTECLAHNAEPGFLNVGAVSKGFSETCSGGCQYKMQPGTGGCTTVGGIGGGAKLCVGEFEFTGNACGLPSSPAPPEPLPNKPQECIPVSGQSVCAKPDGKLCYSGAIGTPMQFCWNPGETGEQSNGDQQQQRDAGPDPQPPRQQPTSPETLGNPTPPITTTTTTSSGGTITTTTTTRTTGNGTTPPGTPGGQPTGPDGQPLDGDGEDGEDGTSTGGDTCSSAPTGSGGDPLLHAVILQAWRIRCPHGENPLPSAENASGQSGGGEHPSVDSLFTTVGGEGVQADDAGFGLPRSCPALDLPQFVLRGQTIQMPWMTMCGWLEILSGMVVLVAYMQFAYIVANSLRGG